MDNHAQIDWAAEAAATERSTRVFIGASDQEPNGTRIKLQNPADGQAGLDYRGSSERQIDEAVKVARDSQGGGRWWNMPAAARRACLVRLSELMTQNAATLAIHDCMDVGKPISLAQTEAHIASSMCLYFGELADKLYAGRIAPSDPGSNALQVRKPRGVVAAIVPWNFPIINATLKLAPALAAGNSVLLKPSELSPGSAQILVGLCLEAGMPPGTVSFLPGDGGVGSALAHHAGVDMLTFTGSTATGKALMRAAGDSTIKPLLLECGGKSPELVFEDARHLGVNALASAIIGGCMANQGQLCVARSRLYVQESLYDELVTEIRSQLEAMKPGVPLDAATTFGPLASPNQLSRVLELIESGVNDGANLLVDGREASRPNDGGCYLAPSLFANTDPSMRIHREEIFGPVLSVASFANEAEAVELANSTDYGLAATAWTTDLGRSQRLIRKIETGGLQIRSTADQRFGAGWGREGEPAGQSGFGIEGGQLGVYSYTRVQWIQFDFALDEAD
ncbi:MAG: aldehyde dehydrogenase family protein [Gammaproteobacteria bacterium]|nr:aldehyde dehydrogenase family protein [Gammaproteobacteria bacterium]